MSTKELVLETNYDVKIEHGRFQSLVTVEAEEEKILSHFSIASILAHFDIDELLEEIGEEACREHFDID